MQSDKKADALLIYKDDIDSRNMLEWFKAQSNFFEPLHKYRGQISLQDKIFVFRGSESYTNKPHLLTFAAEQLKEIHLGFDNSYRLIEDRGFGMTFQPLRLTVENGNKSFVLYLVTNFNMFMRSSDNKNWLPVLQQWRGEAGVI